MNNNQGFEYEITAEAVGAFIEVYPTDERGERGELHLSLFVNSSEGETVEAAIKTAIDELNDPVFCLEHNIEGEELARQREAIAWLAEAYPSIQQVKRDSF